GQSVTVFLVCGHAGPVSIHSPDSCYAAAGYKPHDMTVFTLPAAPGGTAADFKTARMTRTKAAEQTNLRIFWSWSATGAWKVPDAPRVTFARHPALYKLYLIRELSRPGEPVEGDACVELMRQLLPELQRALFSAGS